MLVVATGAWAGELLPGLNVTGKAGVSFRLLGTHDPVISPWAPYKQVVVHQQTRDTIWVGDGSTILPRNWTAQRDEQCLARCLGVVGKDKQLVKKMYGVRPYANHPKSEPCLLRKLSPRVWVATGAGKSGTIAAGWTAWRITSELPS